MSEYTGASLIEHLKKVPDPRVKRSRRHELMDILVIALCATLGGANDWVEVVQFGQAKQEWQNRRPSGTQPLGGGETRCTGRWT